MYFCTSKGSTLKSTCALSRRSSTACEVCIFFFVRFASRPTHIRACARARAYECVFVCVWSMCVLGGGGRGGQGGGVDTHTHTHTCAIRRKAKLRADTGQRISTDSTTSIQPPAGHAHTHSKTDISTDYNDISTAYIDRFHYPYPAICHIGSDMHIHTKTHRHTKTTHAQVSPLYARIPFVKLHTRTYPLRLRISTDATIPIQPSAS